MSNSIANGWRSVQYAAEFLEVSPGQVRSMIAYGRLPAVNVSVGGKKPRYRIRQRDLESFGFVKPAKPERVRRPKLPPVKQYFQ